MKSQKPHERGARMLRTAGYKRGGGIDDDSAEDAKQIASGVHQHEAHLHKGEKKTKLKLKVGGAVHGEGEESRPDRRARGGSAGKHKSKVTININAAQKGDPAREQMAQQAGVQKGLMIGRAMPHPAGPPPGAPMPPPGGAPMMPPGGAPPMMAPRPPMAGPPAGMPPGPMGARPPGMP